MSERLKNMRPVANCQKMGSFLSPKLSNSIFMLHEDLVRK